jgi:hypothetical protein
MSLHLLRFCRQASLWVPFHDTQVEYKTLAALTCNGKEMVIRVPHALEGHYVQHYQHEQDKIEATYLAECGADSVNVLTAQQQEKLAELRCSGRYECHHSTTWQEFALNSRNENSRCNHIYSVMPTGMSGFIDAMAAAKEQLEAAGGR